jgi:hypothetical protein
MSEFDLAEVQEAASARIPSVRHLRGVSGDRQIVGARTGLAP